MRRGGRDALPPEGLLSLTVGVACMYMCWLVGVGNGSRVPVRSGLWVGVWVAWGSWVVLAHEWTGSPG